MDSTSCLVQANPDITGVGVRISMYTLSLGGPLISCIFTSQDLRESIEISLGITGFALLLTAFVFTGQHKLDLFHAICLFHLIGLVGLTVTPSNIKFKNKFHRFFIYGAFYGGFLGFAIFMIYVFATAPHFGTNPECNDTIRFVIFGINIPATNFIFRIYLIVNFCLLLVREPVMGLLQGFFQSAENEEDDSETRGFSIAKVLCESTGRIYLIVMIELLLKRNPIGPGEGEWGFGQILSMMMLVGPVFQFIMELGKETWSKFGEGFKDLSDFAESVFLQIVIGSIDFALVATGGAAAAATGAHVNGSEVTAEIVRSGALAAVMASGLLTFCTIASGYNLFDMLSGSGSTGHPMKFFLTVGVTTFGIAFLVVFAMSQRLLGEVPDAMLIASLAAAFPLTMGSSIQQLAIPNMNGLPITAVFDTLGAFVFVRVSQDHGFHVCTGRAAAAAGAVFGCILYVLRLPYAIAVKSSIQGAW
ncbi:hypothetical protein GALMADRAFT_1295472 [Galerina marginata CBS 339.88]|uniref:Uncharacterized protein n=1 Tax=Galerina marginata (strain CBS 339.88) TaxID=685588 RepID=A0A067T6M7_GALM3|nr:hypothetical protein GALMADRAFT_1295472 [Galerina marginata CBS 339.88]